MGYALFVVEVDCKPVKLIEDVEARYHLSVTLDNDYEDMMTYIMMNPSKADKLISDDTVNKVIDFAFDQTNKEDSTTPNIGRISIVNLFGVYKSDSAKLQSTLDIVKTRPALYNQMLTDNRNKINEFIRNSKYIVLAWGDVPLGMKTKIHKEEVVEVYNSIVRNNKQDSVYVLKSRHHQTILTKKKRPRHPNRIMPLKYIKSNALEVKRKFLYISY